MDDAGSRKGRGRLASKAAIASTGALAAVAALVAACAGDPDEEPAVVPHPVWLTPLIVEAGPTPLVEHRAPRDSLLVREGPARGELTLLFYRGRGVSRDAAGTAYVPDAEASRVLAIGTDLRVRRTVGGPSPESGGLGLPLSVAATRAGELFVIDAEHPRGLLFFASDGEYVGAARPPVKNPNIWAAPDGGLWAARSPYILGFEPTPPEEPLLYRFDPLAGRGVAISRVEAAPDPRATRLVNAGSVAAGPDGTAYFAFLLRNEIRAYGPEGSLLWRSRRELPFPVRSPETERVGEELTLRARPVTQALATGPDGLLYALTAMDRLGEEMGADAPLGSAGVESGEAPAGEARRRVEVYDPVSGDLLAAATIPAHWTTLAVDAGGRLRRADPEAILRSAPQPERRPLPSVAVESFDGEWVDLDSYRGRALLVNLWASWCEPCRRELPALKRYYEGLTPEQRRRVEFLAISEDTDTRAARRFAEPLALPFPLFLGRGKMRDHFRYVGLPYTLIVDSRGRIVEEIHGFGSDESWHRLTSTLEREMERAVPALGNSSPHGHHHDHGPER